MSIKVIVKLFLLFISTIAMFIVNIPFYLLGGKYSTKLMNYTSYIAGIFQRHVIGINLKVDDQVDWSKNYLVVGNHLSYLDIIVMCSFRPSCFVAAMDYKDDPFWGNITKLSGCYFIDRTSRDNLQNEINDITELLNQGLNVTFFPEGKPMPGEKVERFKKPFFQVGINANVDVAVFTINYKSINGETINLENKEKLHWYRQIPMMAHYIKVLEQGNIEVELKVRTLSKNYYQADEHVSEIAQKLCLSNYNLLNTP